MRNLGTKLLQSMLNITYYSGLSKMLSPLTQGEGIVLMLHHILPKNEDKHCPKFDPNGLLEITPEFLDQVLEYLTSNDYEIISLEAAIDRLQNDIQSNGKPYVVFTIDDGYLDNLEYAHPIFKKYDAPYSIFIATDLPEQKLFMWWKALEDVVRAQSHIEFKYKTFSINHACESLEDKYHVYEKIYWYLRDISEQEKREMTALLCQTYHVDPYDTAHKNSLSWEQIKEIEQDVLVTIGAHTIDHSSIAKLPIEAAKEQIIQSKRIIKENTGIECEYFCYPYGSDLDVSLRDLKLVEEMGYKAAVTTQKGLIYREHKDHLMSLPRVSLNGEFQQMHHVKNYLTGAPFMLFNKFKKVKQYQ